MLLRVIVGIHVLAGLTAVVAGARAMLVPKGRRRHRRSGLTYVTALGVICGTAPVLAAVDWSQFWYLIVLAVAAAGLGLVGYFNRPTRRPTRLAFHISGMGGAYIVMLTAFYVDNGPKLPIWENLPRIVFWFLPAVVGVPILVRALMRWGGRSRSYV